MPKIPTTPISIKILMELNSILEQHQTESLVITYLHKKEVFHNYLKRKKLTMDDLLVYLRALNDIALRIDREAKEGVIA